IEAKVLRVDCDKRRVSIGMKQLQPQPWDSILNRYQTGDRVRGTVTRITDFGAFVELEPGVEGLIHVSEMSWVKRVHKPGDLVKPGESVETVILGINAGEKRISLGLKQALGDPWADAAQKFAVGSVVEGSIVSLTKFGAFVQLADGIEGMIHVSDISAEKRINHPQDVFKVGQSVKAQVLELDSEKRRLKLGIKQMAPTSIDEYLDEHQPGDVVSGRLVEVHNGVAVAELGEGVRAKCLLATGAKPQPGAISQVATDLQSLRSMLEARWKSGTARETSKPTDVQPGQVRSFRIRAIDRPSKNIEVELA